MVLTEKEEALLNSLRTLPGGVTDQVLHWAQQMNSLAQGRQVD